MMTHIRIWPDDLQEKFLRSLQLPTYAGVADVYYAWWSEEIVIRIYSSSNHTIAMHKIDYKIGLSFYEENFSPLEKLMFDGKHFDND